jgi:hypothetical protein
MMVPWAAMLVFCQIVAKRMRFVGGYFHGENADRAWQGLALGCCRSDPVGLRLRLVDRGILANGEIRHAQLLECAGGLRSPGTRHPPIDRRETPPCQA